MRLPMAEPKLSSAKCTKHDYRMYSDVADEIRKRRTNAGLSRRDMAMRLGLKETALESIEEGRVRCPLHVLVAVAEELDTTLDELVPVAILGKDER